MRALLVLYQQRHTITSAVVLQAVIDNCAHLKKAERGSEKRGPSLTLQLNEKVAEENRQVGRESSV